MDLEKLSREIVELASKELPDWEVSYIDEEEYGCRFIHFDFVKDNCSWPVYMGGSGKPNDDRRVLWQMGTIRDFKSPVIYPMSLKLQHMFTTFFVELEKIRTEDGYPLKEKVNGEN